MSFYSFDFETTTDSNDCRVWAWGSYEVFSEEFHYGNDMESFLKFLENEGGNQTLQGSFHNLKFDGEFIIYYLLKNGWKYSKDRNLNTREFSALIGDMGQYYCIEMQFPKKRVKLIDSLKIFTYSIHDLALSLHLEEKKGSIDYDKYREVGHVLTEEEVSYLKNDCVIAGKAMRIALERGDKKMTAGANALSFYRSQIGKKYFEKRFPKLSEGEDTFIRKSYKGGFCYANPLYQCKDIGEGIVFDVNSLYPSRMKMKPLPYGKPVFFIGQYEEDKTHPLYVQRLECSFKLKKGYLPTIQLKHTIGFHQTEYVESTDGEVVELTLTNVDLALFLEHYDVADVYYKDGYMFHASTSLFSNYVDYWMEEKKRCDKEGDHGGRVSAKLKMNSLYGKFAKRPKARRKIPYLDLDEDRVKYTLSDEEDVEALYIPVGTFITSWARDLTIRSAQSVHDRFLYADTDSLHLIGTEIPECIEVDAYELGKWKHEGTFRRARYLGAKTYVEDLEATEKEVKRFLEENPERESQVSEYNGKKYILTVTCAGLPDRNRAGVTFDNFHYGFKVDNKLLPVHVSGGIVLMPEEFEIKDRRLSKKNVSRETSKRKRTKNVSRETFTNATEKDHGETRSSRLQSIKNHATLDLGG